IKIIFSYGLILFLKLYVFDHYSFATMSEFNDIELTFKDSHINSKKVYLLPNDRNSIMRYYYATNGRIWHPIPISANKILLKDIYPSSIYLLIGGEKFRLEYDSITNKYQAIQDQSIPISKNSYIILLCLKSILLMSIWFAALYFLDVMFIKNKVPHFKICITISAFIVLFSCIQGLFKDFIIAIFTY